MASRRLAPLAGGEVFEEDAAGLAVLVGLDGSEAGPLLGGGALVGEGCLERLEGGDAGFDELGAVVLGGVDDLVQTGEDLLGGADPIGRVVDNARALRKLDMRAEGAD